MVPATYTVRITPGAPELQFQFDVTPQGGTPRALPVSNGDAMTILLLLRLPGHLLFDKTTGTLIKEG
jgi:hypothetical protein